MTWDNIPGHFNWHHLYARWAAQLPPNAVCVEVGVYLGRSLAFMADQLKQGGRLDVRLWGVDLFGGPQDHPDMDALVENSGGSFLHQTASNLARCGVQSQIRLLQCESYRAADLFNWGECSLVYLDACHDFENVDEDIEAWRRMVKRGGGILAGHDYGKNFDGVTRAVDAAAVRFGWDLNIDQNTWWVEL